MPTNILVLRLSSLGDVVLTSSFLRSARAVFPDAHFEFVVRDDLETLAQALPEVARVHPIPRRARPRRLLQLAAELARGGFAHVFDLHQSLRSRLLTSRLRAVLRGGFDKQSLARWLLIHAHRDVYDRLGGSRSMRQRMLLPLQRMGLQPPLLPTQLLVGDTEKQWARERLDAVDDATRWVALAPGALWPSKQWIPERFVEVARRLLRAADRGVLLVGGPREQALCERIAAQLHGPVVDASGAASVLHTAALLQRCALTVSNDSGLLHVAEAVGSPVVALFGPTSPRFGYAPHLPDSRLLYHPPSCSPCSKNGSRPCARPTHECMLALSTEQVTAAAEAILSTEISHVPGSAG